MKKYELTGGYQHCFGGNSSIIVEVIFEDENWITCYRINPSASFIADNGKFTEIKESVDTSSVLEINKKMLLCIEEIK